MTRARDVANVLSTATSLATDEEVTAAIILGSQDQQAILAGQIFE